MQQTFQTNDKNINKYQKQFVVITIAKKTYTKYQNQLQTIVKHVKHATNIPNK